MPPSGLIPSDFSYSIRLAQATDVAFLADIERAAAQQFMPYLEWLEIPTHLLEGLTTPGFLLRAQADERLWVAVIADQAVAADKVIGFLVAKYLADSFLLWSWMCIQTTVGGA